MASAGPPARVISRIQAEVAKFIQEPDVKERFAAIGATAVGSTPEEFTRFLNTETGHYAKLVKEANIKVD